MKQEEKELVLKDLCCRLPYGVVVELDEKFGFNKGTHKLVKELLDLYCVEGIKPYLRSMSSMTEEERKEYNEYLFHGASIGLMSNTETAYELIDWLNAHHFDYRGLIERDLAIAVTEENNPYEKEE